MGIKFSFMIEDPDIITSSDSNLTPALSSEETNNIASSLEADDEERTTLLSNKNPSNSLRQRGRVTTPEVYGSFLNIPNITRSSVKNLFDMTSQRSASYFSNYTTGKGILYTCAIIYVVSCSIVSIIAPYVVKCDMSVYSKFENPGYAYGQNCHHTRHPKLLFLTSEECSFGRRILFSSLFGALIGWERRQADRPAGIRTMSLVSLGACLFSICSAYAFIDGPMNWDGSRVAAAIPSGVGFLGAGIIWKEADNETHLHSVHGLTTAASLWLSAAVGIACSGELYFPASFAIAVMMVMVRFGPRIITTKNVPDFSSERDEEIGRFRPKPNNAYHHHSDDDDYSDNSSLQSSSLIGSKTSLPISSSPHRNMPSIRE